MRKINVENIKIVFTRDFRDFIKRKIFILYAILSLIGAISIAIGMLNKAQEVNGGNTSEGQMLWLIILANVLIVYTILPQIISIPLFTTTTLAKEKSRSVITSLLATRLTPFDILIGKSLAVFLPGYFISLCSTIIMVPWFHSIIHIPFSLIISAVILLPLLMLGVTVITIQISMFKHTEISVAPSYIVGLLLLFGIPLASTRGIIHLSSYSFSLICFTSVFVIGIFSVLISKKMTKENIVLSQS